MVTALRVVCVRAQAASPPGSGVRSRTACAPAAQPAASQRVRRASGAAGSAPALRGALRRGPVRPQAAALPAVLFTDVQLAGSKPANGSNRLLAALPLPLALVSVLLYGFHFPTAGVLAGEAGGVTLATSLVFLLTGLGLSRAEVAQAFSAKWAALYAMLSTLVLSPLLGIPLMRYAAEYLPQVHPELFAGLAVMLCMPTTLSTGVILTQQVGGNAALALLLLISTNVVGVFSLPFVLREVFDLAGVAVVDPLPLVESLARTMLAPLLLGVTVRAVVPFLWRLIDWMRPLSRLLQQACLVATPWMSISLYAPQLAEVAPVQLAWAAGAAAAVHALLLLANSIAAWVLGLGGRGRAAARTRRPVVLAASQKTLPVCIAVLHQLEGALGTPGLIVLPCIFYHMLQVLMGSMLVGVWLQQDHMSQQ